MLFTNKKRNCWELFCCGASTFSKQLIVNRGHHRILIICLYVCITTVGGECRLRYESKLNDAIAPLSQSLLAIEWVSAKLKRKVASAPIHIIKWRWKMGLNNWTVDYCFLPASRIGKIENYNRYSNRKAITNRLNV